MAMRDKAQIPRWRIVFGLTLLPPHMRRAAFSDSEDRPHNSHVVRFYRWNRDLAPSAQIGILPVDLDLEFQPFAHCVALNAINRQKRKRPTAPRQCVEWPVSHG
jgi:hypothetical protein